MYYILSSLRDRIDAIYVIYIRLSTDATLLTIKFVTFVSNYNLSMYIKSTLCHLINNLSYIQKGTVKTTKFNPSHCVKIQ